VVKLNLNPVARNVAVRTLALIVISRGVDAMARLAVNKPGVIKLDVAPITGTVAGGALHIIVVYRRGVARPTINQAGVIGEDVVPTVGVMAIGTLTSEMT
jgi:hypothetical protein